MQVLLRRIPSACTFSFQVYSRSLSAWLTQRFGSLLVKPWQGRGSPRAAHLSSGSMLTGEPASRAPGTAHDLPSELLF